MVKSTSRKLVLKKETIRTLSEKQLREAAGGVDLNTRVCLTPVILTIPVNSCLR